MERFNKFIDVILSHEGGYVWDSDDFGGETNFGITKRRYPGKNIRELTIEQATELYYTDFYTRMCLYYIKSDLLALHVFDMGVNAGKGTAVELLQEILKGCRIDGQIGPATAQAIANADISTNLVAAYKAKRIEYYYNVSLRRNNAKFLAGWVNRVYSTKL